MDYIVIAPYAQKLRNGKINPKNFPYWKELIQLLEPKYKIIQVGVNGEEKLTKAAAFNLDLDSLKELLINSKFWISVDSFLPHLAHHINKKGVVIWGPSDPNIFGYKENINILKDRKYLRSNQFDIWEVQEFNADAFVSAENIYKTIINNF